MKNEKGYNIHEILLNECDRDYKQFQKKLTLSEEKKDELNQLLLEIKKPNSDTTEKGKQLEMLTKSMFDLIGFFDSYANIHTSTNEIDFFCKLSPSGRNAKSKGFIGFEDEFLVECKNYASKVGVTYVGKFASLLQAHNKKFGIMVSSKGITGNGWNDSIGLTKKLYLKSDILIISFDFDDFQSLNEESFFSIVERKKDEIINDSDLTKYITKHPAE
ncbi:restriction endonuclease [Planococcus sp. SIMBA_143]